MQLDRSTLTYLLFGLALAWLIHALSPILSPFLIAAFLAYLGDPIVDRFEARGFGRTTGVSIVFLTMLLGSFLTLILLLPVLEAQIRRVVEGMPGFIAYAQTQFIPRIESVFSVDVPELDAKTLATAAQKNWEQLGGFAGIAAGWLGNSTQILLALVASLTIVPVVTFYLLRDWDVLVAHIHGLIPREAEPKTVELAKEVDQVLAEFFRGQLLLMAIQAAYFSVALSLIGLNMGILIGLLAGAVSFVPYLGMVIGIGAGVIAALMQFQELTPVILVLVVFGVGQVLEGVVLQPMLIGDRIGMHPVAVIFAVMAGGQLFGFIGVLIALPAAAVITVFLRHIHEFYKASNLYGVYQASDELTDDISLDQEAD